jgi:RNA polymerase sigma factor (sigma-70 family)
LVGAAGREYSAQLFAFGARCCASYGVDSTIAQDAVQDIFIALLAEHDRAGTSYAVLQGDPSQLKAYLFRAVQLRVQTLARGENRRAVNEGYVALVQADRMTLSPAELYDAGEFEKYIDATLAQCPDRAVQAYRLVREHELTYKETGKVMGISTQTVGAHLNLIAKRLQAAVRAWQSSASGDVV